MKRPLTWLLVLVVLALEAAGLAFLGTATSDSNFLPREGRTSAMVAGISCLVIGSGLLVFGVCASRKQD